MIKDDLYYKSKAYQNREKAIKKKELCAYCGKKLKYPLDNETAGPYIKDNLAFCHLVHYQRNRILKERDQT